MRTPLSDKIIFGQLNQVDGRKAWDHFFFFFYPPDLPKFTICMHLMAVSVIKIESEQDSCVQQVGRLRLDKPFTV